MRYVLFVAIPVLLSSCAATAPSKTEPRTASSKTTVIATIPTDDAIVVKGKRCKFDKPSHPRPLARPLPVENPKTLIDVLTNKLEEWVNYGNKVEKIFQCRS